MINSRTFVDLGQGYGPLFRHKCDAGCIVGFAAPCAYILSVCAFPGRIDIRCDGAVRFCLEGA